MFSLHRMSSAVRRGANFSAQQSHKAITTAIPSSPPPSSPPSSAAYSSRSSESKHAADQTNKIPTDVNIAIIGGGVIGCSIAYHLSKLGVKKIYLFERAVLTHGCTWHAAGLLGQLRGSNNLTRMLQYSAQCYGRLEQETGVDPEWKADGSIRLASSIERWQEIRRSASQAKAFGFEMQLISAQEAKQLCPILDINGVLGAAYIPSDGHVEPTSLTNAFATGARNNGVRIIQGVQMVGAQINKRQVTAIQLKSTESNELHTVNVNIVVNCGGLWGREVGTMLGTNIPTINLQHQYAVTDSIPDLPKRMPSFRDPDLLLYYKPEGGGLVIGGWENNTIPVQVPYTFGPELYEPNWERFEQHAINAEIRTPIVNSVGIKKLINGPIPISPDGEPIMGRCPEKENVYVAAGFTAGIGAAGGAGKAMSEWIVYGAPEFDLFPLDIRRFGQFHNNRTFLEQRTVEAYASYYRVRPPGVEPSTGRKLRVSPLYEQLKAQGAVFGTKFGWERANWFAAGTNGQVINPNGQMKVDLLPSYHQPIWFDAVGMEHKTAREQCVIIDQSSFAKFVLAGPRAFETIQYLTVNDMNVPVGKCVYTQMCNEQGGIEADVTITRVKEDEFYIVTGSGFAVRDSDWIRSHLPRTSDGQVDGVTFEDVTTKYAVINVAGPTSRKLLQLIGTSVDLSNESFPLMSSRHIEIGSINVLCVRVTLIGEVGYELHVPVEQAARLYEIVCEHATDEQVKGRPAGYYGLESLRLEAGYRVWGAELTPTTNPYEVGLGFCVKVHKGEFVGRSALVKAKHSVTRRLMRFTVDPSELLDSHPQVKSWCRPRPLVIYGNEAILFKNQVIGYSTSAGYAYSIGKMIGYAFIPIEYTHAHAHAHEYAAAGAGAPADGRHFDLQLEAYGKRIPIKMDLQNNEKRRTSNSL